MQQKMPYCRMQNDYISARINIMTQPDAFSANWPVIGHNWAIDQLRRALQFERIRHAYLITGTASIGKTTLAWALATALNCQGETPPCGQCRSCKLMAAGSHSDVVMVEAEQVGGTLKIEQVRDLQYGLALRPYEGRFKVAILRRFHEANHAAQNALLKTLEEPSSQVVLILTAEHGDLLLPTIVSRCQVLNLRPLGLEETETALRNYWTVEPEQATLLARLSGGRIGWAIRSITDTTELDLRHESVNALEQAITGTRYERFQLAEDLAKDKPTLLTVLDIWQTYWRDVLLATTGSQAALVNIDHESAILQIASVIVPEDAQRALEATRRAVTQLGQNANTRLCIEVLLLDYPFVKPFQ
ncbi:MAG: DNA polymerase III subunit delta' [Chloroflexi bacterium]|nr:DNA polymerase III subunit delta' [Chloroflexota bacterium]